MTRKCPADSIDINELLAQEGLPSDLEGLTNCDDDEAGLKAHWQVVSFDDPRHRDRLMDCIHSNMEGHFYGQEKDKDGHTRTIRTSSTLPIWNIRNRVS